MVHFEVFLAHSSADKEYVRSIHHLLTLDGFYPWLDEINLIAGQDWELEIARAVERAGSIAVFLSKSAVSSAGYLHKEIAIALEMAQRQPEGSIAIIPIRLDSVEPPHNLRHLQWIDVNRDNRHLSVGKSQYPVDLDPEIRDFIIGKSYLRLRHALLHRAKQVGGSNFSDPSFLDSSRYYKSRPPLAERYLVHGRSPNGNTYFGKAEIIYHPEGLEMLATIGVEEHIYTGEFVFEKLQFSGAHDVCYMPSVSGILVGSWATKGLEELIPALEIAKNP